MRIGHRVNSLLIANNVAGERWKEAAPGALVLVDLAGSARLAILGISGLPTGAVYVLSNPPQ